jgi:hypothetical protein
MIKTMEEAVFKRPMSLFWPERVRKLVTPFWETGRRPFWRPFQLTDQNGRQNGLGPVSQTGRGPFWDPF